MSGIRSNVAELVHDDFEELSGFLVVRGRLRRIHGVEPINTTALSGRILGVTTWQRETA